MANTLPTEIQRELQAIQTKINDLLQKMLSGDSSMNISDLHREIVIHQNKINKIMEDWKARQG